MTSKSFISISSYLVQTNNAKPKKAANTAEKAKQKNKT